MSPENLVRNLNELFRAFDELASELGVEKIKQLAMLIWQLRACPNPIQIMLLRWH